MLERFSYTHIETPNGGDRSSTESVEIYAKKDSTLSKVADANVFSEIINSQNEISAYPYLFSLPSILFGTLFGLIESCSLSHRGCCYLD